mmetsp:Transcript_1485/g.4507  ORF Transcript_1485/g.4507 Transcript_1485/m.4507 type:complete len:302 (+) Transcript_1485:1608-2513(+)
MRRAENVPYAADACRNAGFNFSIDSRDTSPSFRLMSIFLVVPLVLSLFSSCISSSSSPYKYCFDVFFNLASARCSLHSMIPAIGSNTAMPSKPNGFNSFISMVVTRIIARLNSTISHMDEGIVTPENFFKSCFFLKLLLPPLVELLFCFLGVDIGVGVGVGAPRLSEVPTVSPPFIFSASSLASSSSASKTSSGISEGSLECVVLINVSSSIFSGNTGNVLPFPSFAMMTFDGAREIIPPGNFFAPFVSFVLSKTVSIVDFSVFLFFPSFTRLSPSSSELVVVDTHCAPLGGTNPPKSSNI